MLLRTCALVLQKEPSRPFCLSSQPRASPGVVEREALNETLQILPLAARYPKNPMDRPAAATPNHKTSAPQAANLGEFPERSAFWK